MERSRGAVESLLDRSPRRARLIGSDGAESMVPVESLRPGDLMAVLPGELAPADCRTEAGESEADESTLTGEARPVRKGPGDPLSDGTLNGWGRLTARVVRTQQDSAALGMAAYVVAAGAPLTVGVAVHEGSTVLVCLNELRLLAFRPGRRSAQLPP